MKTVSQKEIKDRLGIDVEQERREQQTLDRLCSFLHRVAMVGVQSKCIGLDGRVPVEALVRQGFGHPDQIAKQFIGRDHAEYALDDCHLKLVGGFFWTTEGKRYGSLELIDSYSRENFPNFAKEVDELIASYFPNRNS